ncbi:maleylacetoacetate isomerase [Parvularcula sp. LCG005]|uniref:maleylacetoacetate isomerase n=1 Tax=Parvularcula sp. LCG005 TaxID=3078805 RepID=UPI0029430B60|nr:maleylacetoacetate isomerase [Parvularcula sp. LCG005]WOI54520.1 maleylacetoacetate isomerase [Parvularcula sp. LCG005]
MILYGYWRSGTSYRTRLALAIKGLEVEHRAVDLRKAEQKAADYTAINPQGLVPLLILDNGTAIAQSPAIIEYLDEAYPKPSLLPSDPLARARVRQMAAIIGCDVHPLNNLRVLKYLKGNFGQDQVAIDQWAAEWIGAGFSALEAMLANDNTRGQFCHGDRPGLVECYLLPQIYSARRFSVDLSPYRRILAIEAASNNIDALAAAAPERQPDAD